MIPSKSKNSKTKTQSKASKSSKSKASKSKASKTKTQSKSSNLNSNENEYLKQLDNKEKELLKQAKHNATYNELVKLGVCTFKKCNDGYMKAKEIKKKCYTGNKNNKEKQIQCYLKNINKGNTITNQLKCVRKNCKKEFDTFTKKNFQNYKKILKSKKHKK